MVRLRTSILGSWNSIDINEINVSMTEDGFNPSHNFMATWDGADGNGFTTLYTVFIFQPYLIGGLEHDFFYFSIYWEE